MKALNRADLIRRSLITELARIFYEKKDYREIDALPVKITRDNGESMRCCVYKDRAVIRHRILALLGYDYEDDDEVTPMSEYARKAAGERDGSILTLLKSACDGCVDSSYKVTDSCRGCVARPCTMNCPVKAIDMVRGKAVIDPDKCISCGKCMKVCPYHAVIYTPVPCEEACPVKAIYRTETGERAIDREKCISCGKCMAACPFSAVALKSDLLGFFSALDQGKEITAMIAPALLGQFNTEPEKIYSALKKAGFNNVIEVSEGAEVTASTEWEEVREAAEKNTFITTSCCPAYKETVNKHIPELAPHVSDTKAPLYYTSLIAEKRYPGSVKVFISPCPAKKLESMRENSADLVITIEELGSMLVALNIDVGGLIPEENLMDYETGRLFPMSGGVTEALKIKAGDEASAIRPVVINGIDKKQINLLKVYAKGRCPGNILEVMTCEGGCVGGPACISLPEMAKKMMAEKAGAKVDT